MELGLQTIDGGNVPGNGAEHLEGRLVMLQPGAGRWFVKSRRWEQRQLPDFGDLVRGEDRDRVGLGAGYAIAQLALARFVIADR